MTSSLILPEESMPWVPGILLAEIQQTSDITYRISDGEESKRM